MLPPRAHRPPALALLALFLVTPALHAQTPATLTIDPTTLVSPVSPLLYGIMAEEINHAFDGGLSPELVNNRTFRESWKGLEHWSLLRRGSSAATLTPDPTTGPSAALPTSARLAVTAASPTAQAGLSNTGFWGMGLVSSGTYPGSLFAQADHPANLTIQLVDDRTAAIVARTEVTLTTGTWTRYPFVLHTAPATAAGSAFHLELLLSHPATVHLQLVSLLQPTFHNRPDGLRADLMLKLSDLHPAFLRFPGGEYLEGHNVTERYNFTRTIGPMVDRAGHPTPYGYWSTDAMGLLEFLEWAEDLHIEPVLAVYAGFNLDHVYVTPGRKLRPYVNDALNEVEYITGDPSTPWGARRARDGHPAPFHLRYLEIGNEDWADLSGSYNARFTQFARALRARYPALQLIATTPINPPRLPFTVLALKLWLRLLAALSLGDLLHPAQPDLLDSHTYRRTETLLDLSHLYDSTPRNGPKIFAGEWSALANTPTPNFGAALADAAFMTGLERNSDIVVMACYAPLLANLNPEASEWHPNLIGFDASHSFGSPSFYAQALFAAHLGAGTARSSLAGANPRFTYSATAGAPDHLLHLKLVNASTDPQPLRIALTGLTSARTATLNTLHAATFESTNTLSSPTAIHPIASTARIPATTPWLHTVPPLTIEVIDIPLQ